MSNESKTIGTREWKEASKKWRIYAFNPAAREQSSESLSITAKTHTESAGFTRETFLGALTQASRHVSERGSRKNGTSE